MTAPKKSDLGELQMSLWDGRLKTSGNHQREISQRDSRKYQADSHTGAGSTVVERRR